MEDKKRSAVQAFDSPSAAAVAADDVPPKKKGAPHEMLLYDIKHSLSKLDDLLELNFPNTAWMCADEGLMRTLFGDRMQLMEMPSDLETMEPLDIPPHRYREIPQSHPHWLAVRQKPRLTGSTVARYVGIHDSTAAAELDLPPSMHVTDEFNDAWDHVMLQLKYGWMPSKFFDQPGATFAMWGKWHENNCLASFLRENEDWTHYECGLTIIDDAMLDKRGLVDLLNDGASLAPFPIELGDSPDGLVMGPDEKTGELIYRAVEFKTGTQFLPDNSSPYPLGQYRMRKVAHTYPYPRIKPYYVQQCMFHMLALDVDECVFASWTFGGGMKTWIIKFSPEYLSILLSLLKYICTEFVANERRVPTNFFSDIDVKATPHLAPHRALFRHLVQMTKDIVNNTAPNKIVTGISTRATTEAVTVRDSTGPYKKFPRVPSEYPDFQKLFFFAAVLLGDTAGLQWVEKSAEIDARTANLKYIQSRPQFDFVATVVADIASGGVFDDARRRIPVVREQTVLQCEAYVLGLMRLIYSVMHDPQTRRPAAINDAAVRVRAQCIEFVAQIDTMLEVATKHAGNAGFTVFPRNSDPVTGPYWGRTMAVVARGLQHMRCARTNDKVARRMGIVDVDVLLCPTGPLDVGGGESQVRLHRILAGIHNTRLFIKTIPPRAVPVTNPGPNPAPKGDIKTEKNDKS